MRKLLSFIVLLLALSIFAEIKIGILLPLTGGISAFGDWTKKGIELAHKQKGTALGEKITLVYADTRSEKTEAANAMARLIDKEKVVAVIGEIASSNSMAAAEIAEARKVPQVAVTSTNPLVTQGKKFVSRVCFIDPLQGTALAEFAAKNLKAKKVTIFVDIEQDYSVGLTNYFTERFEKKYKGQVLKVQYKSGDQEFSAQISQAIAFGSDVIMMTGYYNEIALIAQQARSMGYKGYFIAGDGADAPELVKIGGKAVEGLYFTTHYVPEAATTKLAKDFVEAFKKQYGTMPAMNAALGYDAYMLIVDAIERAKSKDPVKINTAIRSTKGFQGVSGTITIDENGNAIKDVIIVKVQNGQFKYETRIEPKDLQ
ncbi:ABC transporter substrate-binding protein [Fervidobacterium islandicum]|uniref:ABC transporter substrate-binding protein n=1 Tax=Fervidobacterium islandicum TaxID=2423 RepID=UPI003A7A02C4